MKQIIISVVHNQSSVNASADSEFRKIIELVHKSHVVYDFIKYLLEYHG